MKQTKKFFILLAVLVLAFSLAVPASAAAAPVTVTLRIEGAEKTLFYDAVEVPYKAELTVLDAIKQADAQDDALTVDAPDGAYGAYIAGINGETAGQVAPLYYDGWSYHVNGKDPGVGVDACEIKSGDRIVLYYADAWGNEAFQIPNAVDTSRLDEGVLQFTSKDTTYDPVTFEPTTTVNPIVGATVTWGYGENQTATYTTDENGEVKIDAAHLTPGKHSVQIEKYSETTVTVGGKLPLVLRLAPDTVVEIEEVVKGEDSSKEKTTDQEDDLESPKTGETAALAIAALVGLAAVCVLVVGQKQTAH